MSIEPSQFNLTPQQPRANIQWDILVKAVEFIEKYAQEQIQKAATPPPHLTSSTIDPNLIQRIEQLEKWANEDLHTLQDQDRRMNHIATNVDANFERLFQLYDDHNTRLELLEERFHRLHDAITQDIEAINERQTVLGNHFGNLQQEIATTTQQLDADIQHYAQEGQNRFERVETRQQNLERSQTILRAQFQQMNSQLDGIERNQNDLAQNLTHLQRTATKLEADIQTEQTQFSRLQTRHQNVETVQTLLKDQFRIAGVHQSKVKRDLQMLRKELKTLRKEGTAHLDRVNTEFETMAKRLQEEKRSRIEAEIHRLRQLQQFREELSGEES